MTAADLHLHSNYSDGTDHPGRIVELAIEADLTCISITDHDITDAVSVARMASRDRIDVVSGVELTADLAGQEIHVLGYFIDEKDAAFSEMLQGVRQARRQRVFDICEKLRALDVDLTAEEVFAFANSPSIGRLHVARALARKGYVETTQEAFRRYIAEGGPAYVSKLKMTPSEAIGWIHRVGGAAVLAHPYVLNASVLIADFVRMGIDGIEVFYPEHSAYQVQEFLQIAEQYHLVATGGSDYHGDGKERSRIGVVRVNEEYVCRLKEAADRHRQKA